MREDEREDDTYFFLETDAVIKRQGARNKKEGDNASGIKFRDLSRQ